MASALVDFQDNLKQAVKELQDIEGMKKSLQDEVSSLARKRDVLVFKMKEEENLSQEKKVKLAEARKAHEKYVEDKNEELSKKAVELKEKEAQLKAEKENLLESKKRLEAGQLSFKELLEKNQVVVNKSDKLKSLLESLSS